MGHIRERFEVASAVAGQLDRRNCLGQRFGVGGGTQPRLPGRLYNRSDRTVIRADAQIDPAG